MGFADRYVSSLNASTLRDDGEHHAAEPLFAAAVADMVGSGLGALLSRVKYADGTQHMLFESGTANLAKLMRIWLAMVTEKGKARGWIKIKTTWDIETEPAFYRRVAERSLAHWLDGKCPACNGTGIGDGRRVCAPCRGTKQADIPGHEYERNKILDMVSELEGLLQAHNARAAALLRKI